MKAQVLGASLHHEFMPLNCIVGSMWLLVDATLLLPYSHLSHNQVKFRSDLPMLNSHYGKPISSQLILDYIHH